jgi:putative DNA primase/helicase
MDTDFIGKNFTEDMLQESRERREIQAKRAEFHEKQRALATVPATHFRLHSALELVNMPPERWLVRGAIPADGLIAIFGPSGSGKTFLTLDLSAHIAAGKDWFGYRVTAAPVVYVALEGTAGLRKRIVAWERDNGCKMPNGLSFLTQPCDVRKLTDVSEIVEAVQKNGGAGLLVIDTLSRAAPGAEENSSKDMGEIIANLKVIQDSLGCAVLLVHHTGKDVNKGLRGHSSLHAALDAAVEVTRDGNSRVWSIAKSKDDADGEKHAFTLKVVDVGEDADGEPVTSCVVVRDEGAVEVARVKLPQGGNQRIAMDALAGPIRESRTFGKGDAPPTHPCIELEAAVPIVAAHLTCEAKRRNERAREALTGLVAKGIYGQKDGWLWRK